MRSAARPGDEPVPAEAGKAANAAIRRPATAKRSRRVRDWGARMDYTCSRPGGGSLMASRREALLPQRGRGADEVPLELRGLPVPSGAVGIRGRFPALDRAPLGPRDLAPLLEAIEEPAVVRKVGPRHIGERGAQMLRPLDPRPHLPDRLLRVTREAEQDRLHQRRVVEEVVAHEVAHPRPDDQRRDAHAEGREGARVAGRDRGRHNVVVEAAVLVVGDDEQRVIPVRAVDERVVELEHERLSGEDVGRRMVVVRGRRRRRGGR